MTVLDQTKAENRYELMFQITPPAAKTGGTAPADLVEVAVKGGHVVKIPVYLN